MQFTSDDRNIEKFPGDCESERIAAHPGDVDCRKAQSETAIGAKPAIEPPVFVDVHERKTDRSTLNEAKHSIAPPAIFSECV
jgi:hypothetical protein